MNAAGQIRFSGLEEAFQMHDVAVVKYERPLRSLEKAIELCDGFSDLSAHDRVFIKPNLVIWMDGVNFPKFGVLTTARMIEDMVVLLSGQGVTDITLLEGGVEYQRGSGSLVAQAAEGMNLTKLRQKYGLKILDVHKGAFKKVEKDGLVFNVSESIFNADFVVNMPVLKTHSQSRVSLGVKNLKGLLNIASRKRCHSADLQQGLDHYLAVLPRVVQPSLTVIDGIFSLERGPLYTGLARRSNMIVASRDLLSADKAAATLLGFDAVEIPHLKMAMENQNRPGDLSDVRIHGGVDLQNALAPHQWEFEYNPQKHLPEFMVKAGIRGIRYPEPDDSLCTYCSHFINYIIMGILSAKNKGAPFNDIEILYGKKQKPSGKAGYTLLAGQCQVRANSDNPLIRNVVKIKGCPPSMAEFRSAYEKLGIQLPEGFDEWMEKSPETLHMRRYLKDSAFDQGLFRLSDEKCQ